MNDKISFIFAKQSKFDTFTNYVDLALLFQKYKKKPYEKRNL